MLTAEEITDAMVVQAVAGDEASVATLLAALAPRVRMMLVARLSPTPQQLAAHDDLSQEVLSSFAKSLPTLQLQTVAGLNAFLSTIVRRRAADFLRAKRAPLGAGRRMASLDSTVAHLSNAGPLWAFLSSGGSAPDSRAARREQLDQMLTTLGSLKPSYREVITMAFFDQLSTSEIAVQLDISRPAASMLLIRAVKALRRDMTGSSRIGHGNA